MPGLVHAIELVTGGLQVVLLANEQRTRRGGIQLDDITQAPQQTEQFSQVGVIITGCRFL